MRISVRNIERADMDRLAPIAQESQCIVILSQAAGRRARKKQMC